MRHKENPGSSRFLDKGSELRIPSVPVEWLAGGPWRLPSGKALAEFALQAGFLTPLVYRSGWFGRGPAADGNSGASRKRIQRA
jgi:hypothetical protein